MDTKDQYEVSYAPMGSPPDSEGRYPLAEVSDRLAFCAKLARALDKGFCWKWWCEDPHFKKIESEQERQHAIDFLSGSLDGARLALFGKNGPPLMR